MHAPALTWIDFDQALIATQVAACFSFFVLLASPLEHVGVAKECCPKFNPQQGRGLNLQPSGWQSEILPNVPTSHTFKDWLASNSFATCQSIKTAKKFYYYYYYYEMFTARWTLGISFCRGQAMPHSLRLRVLSLGSLLFRVMLPFVRVLLLLWCQSSSDVFLGCLLLCLTHQPLLVQRLYAPQLRYLSSQIWYFSIFSFSKIYYYYKLLLLSFSLLLLLFLLLLLLMLLLFCINIRYNLKNCFQPEDDLLIKNIIFYHFISNYTMNC